MSLSVSDIVDKLNNPELESMRQARMRQDFTDEELAELKLHIESLREQQSSSSHQQMFFDEFWNFPNRVGDKVMKPRKIEKTVYDNGDWTITVKD